MLKERPSNAFLPHLRKPFRAWWPDFASLRMVRERGQADLTLFRVRIDVPPAEGLLPGMTLEVRL